MTSSLIPAFVVKVCGITNEEDARVAISAGANALGFNFYRASPRYITPLLAQQIIESVPGEYLRVGIFVNSNCEDMLEIATQVSIDVLQLHGNCGELPATFRVWRAIAPGSAIQPLEAEAFLMDTPSEQFGGSGVAFDWSMAAGHGGRIIIAGGLEATNVAEAIRVAVPWGVDACSRLESSPGKKDALRVREFVSRAITASQRLSQEVTL